MFYLLLLASAVYAVHKIRQHPKRPRLEYRPEWYEPEKVELEPFGDGQDDTEPPAEDDFKRTQAQLDIEHWTAQLEQFKALQATHKAEITAIREYREKKLTVLPSLVEKPIEYMELATWLTENKRDYSEKREATLQRALITDANNIYACQKRIAKAQQKLREV